MGAEIKSTIGAKPIYEIGGFPARQYRETGNMMIKQAITVVQVRLKMRTSRAIGDSKIEAQIISPTKILSNVLTPLKLYDFPQLYRLLG
ncbi:hypothetical protein [Sporosarcina sp. FSL W7-1283]|uniref:Type I secretion outer membrane protein n=1 Tax=Sporosarcina newyorkensis 2681 TaxID=1027292 RepID=F9DSD5_9BACL|nr:type I secretion outer membrane protein [Sporosarcina newyorkensis 2681]